MRKESDSEFRPGQNGPSTTTIGGQFRHADPAPEPDPAHERGLTVSIRCAEPKPQAMDAASLGGSEKPKSTKEPHVMKLHKVHKLQSERQEDPGNTLQAAKKPQAKIRAFTPKQNGVLELIARGSTISEAAEDLNCTPQCISNWKKRKPRFGEALIEAHEEFVRRKAGALHEAEYDAHRFLHFCVNDYTMRPHLRVRAAVGILNRKGRSINWPPTR